MDFIYRVLVLLPLVLLLGLLGVFHLLLDAGTEIHLLVEHVSTGSWFISIIIVIVVDERIDIIVIFIVRDHGLLSRCFLMLTDATLSYRAFIDPIIPLFFLIIMA